MVQAEARAMATLIQRDEATIQLVAIRLGKDEYGIPIHQVKEVTLTPPISRLPNTPRFIKGITNIRGDIIAIVDLEERFKLKKQTLTLPEKSYTVVAEVEEFTLGLIVQEVPTTIVVAESDIERNPQMIQEIMINQQYIEGLAKIGGNLIFILNMEKILNPNEIKKVQLQNK